MPQVPVYDGPQLATAPLRTPTARPLDVSSGTRAIGQGLANLGEGIDRYQEREAQTEAYDVESRVTSDWLKWDSEARAQGRGENVDAYQKSATDWWNTAAETYGKDLSPRARALIGRSLQQKRVQAEASVLGFTSAERERHADEVANADIATTIQFGVTNGDIATTKDQVREKVAVVGARKGWTTEQVQARVAGYVSDMHMAQIDNIPSAEEALAYFDNNVNEIDAGKQGAVRKSLERSVEIEAKQREADAEKAKREAEDRLVDSAWGLYAGGQPVPPSVLAALPGREAAQLANAIESRADREAKGTTIKTDDKLYNQTLLDIASGKQVDLRPLVESFAQADMDRLVKLQQDMTKPDAAAQVATTEQMFSLFKGDMDESDFLDFKRAAYDEISRFQQEKGRAPNYDEKTKIMDDLLIDKVVPGTFWDDETPRYQLDREQRVQEMGPYDPFTVGKTYQDKSGNKAIYRGNGNWESVK
jgi:hypothetical protein